jgi:S1-C subfamily serine protease
MIDYSNKVEKVKPSVVKIISNRAAGSGFIVHKKGIVITANHVVVSDASHTKVRFYDESEKNCSNILHRDNKHDFAILQIEGNNYQTVNLGSHLTIKEGNEVYFCGYPLSSSQHITSHGIVSALFNEDSTRIIQIDGSINSGNSGGPLFDMNDEVIGIITEKAGGVHERLLSLAHNLRENYGNVSVTEPSLYNDDKINFPHQNSILAELIIILHKYTNIGIGYAYSIEYAKRALSKILLS